ncbi:hypothetical protein VCSRO141_2524 [Vibrio cholerae]|nr:hypothetical protein DN33_2904 [Vibrio cholerae]GIB71126.1 hypothetical protein VCSRO141_2524 [Vibrio cholerae]
MALISTPGDSCPPGMRTSPERHLRDDDGDDECSLRNYAYLVVSVCLRTALTLTKLSFFFNHKLTLFWLFFYDGFKKPYHHSKLQFRVEIRGRLASYLYSDANYADTCLLTLAFDRAAKIKQTTTKLTDAAAKASPSEAKIPSTT